MSRAYSWVGSGEPSTVTTTPSRRRCSATVTYRKLGNDQDGAGRYLQRVDDRVGVGDVPPAGRVLVVPRGNPVDRLTGQQRMNRVDVRCGRCRVLQRQLVLVLQLPQGQVGLGPQRHAAAREVRELHLQLL